MRLASSTIKRRPFRARGLPLPPRKRRQRHRRPRRRPPRKHRGEQVLPPSPTAPTPVSGSSDAGAITTPAPRCSQPPKWASEYHSFRQHRPSRYLPLCVWSAQSHAASSALSLGYSLPRDRAATSIQRWFHRHRTITIAGGTADPAAGAAFELNNPLTTRPMELTATVCFSAAESVAFATAPSDPPAWLPLVLEHFEQMAHQFDELAHQFRKPLLHNLHPTP